MNPPNWTILLTHAQAEWQVYNTLIKQGVDCILPCALASSRRGRWAQGVVRPLYPGYLFARAEVSLDTLRRTPGVRDILRTGPRIVFLTPAEAETMRAHARQALDDSRPRRLDVLRLKPGDVIAIPEGPFAGTPAIVEGVDKSGMVRASIGQLQICFPAVRGSAKPAEIPT